MDKPETALLALRMRDWVAQAGAHIRHHIHDPLQIQTKSSRTDLVTNLDKQTERNLIAAIRSEYPDAQIMGEEGSGDHVTDLRGLVFFVDPIDGTMNFVKQKYNFAIMIGAYVDGTPQVGVILNVMRQELYWGGPQLGVYKNETPITHGSELTLADGLFGINSAMLAYDRYHSHQLFKTCAGMRIIGSAGIEYIQLLEGRQIAYMSHLAPWDVAAGRVMAETLGMSVTRLDGHPLDMLSSGDVLIATAPTADAIRAIALG
ncbi:inositol monophosphatase family protein [Schleiferilactobacillus shenzhenensis]|uniref:SuhB n=1 Tax=Schleiferilactobacillus shenzhenensis LY-73 TaxID=1231336 RepID=U4TNP6_9LACO|nr:inositol monophosphatase family protein [Schleiferilactobacillus shenzhenensis]ERL66511.1 SuhB [Schleiferilactobacillus shenzhenensis LY-73]